MKNKILSSLLVLALILSLGKVSFAEEDLETIPQQKNEENQESNQDLDQPETIENIDQLPQENEEEVDTKLEEQKEDSFPNKLEEGTLLFDFLQQDQRILRIQGSNRIATALAISQSQNKQAATVLITSGRNYPDALSASSLSKGSFPILLVEESLTQGVKDELLRLQPQQIILLGGNQAIPLLVEEEIKDLCPAASVLRLAGANRYETSQLAFDFSEEKVPVFASGDNFPDALAASSLLDGKAMILLPSTSKSYQQGKLFSAIEIVGGKTSLSQELEDYFQTNLGIPVKRYAGQNRYATSMAIAQNMESDLALIASGQDFPDALAAASLSQRLQVPILLVEKDDIPTDLIRFLKEKSYKKLILIGGEASISPRVEKNLDLILQGKDPLPKPIPNLSADAVALKEVELFSTSDLKESLKSKLPAKAIVRVLEQADFAVKVDLYGRQGWAKKDLFKNYQAKDFGTVVNKVPYISQLYPVYAPNGCEPTALLMGLKGKGYTNIGLRAYLDAMPKTSSNPKYGYVGVPYNVEQGRFQTIDPEPLTKYGQKYGRVANIQGAPIEDIIKEIQNGNTVVIYATLYWNRPMFRYLPIEGKRTRRIWNNHAVLLTGYDPVKKSFYVADPYNHEKAGGNRRKAFYYWKSQDIVDRCYNYDNRRFSLVVR